MNRQKVQLLRRGLSVLPRRLAIKAEFYLKARYLPDLKQPGTFNEKIQYRKLHWKNTLFAECSDKLRVRAFVAEQVGDDYLIPLLFAGPELSIDILDALLNEHSRVVLKVTNDQGSVVVLSARASVVERINALQFIHARRKSAHTYGKLRHEDWYSENPANIIVEKAIGSADSALEDFKIHTFHHNDECHQVMAVDFERGHEARSRTFYGADLNILPMKQAAFANNEYPCPLSKAQADTLFALARKLASPFSYARVDLYYVDGQIYVGEITFAPGGGFTRFENHDDDLYLGQLWQGDPAN